MQSPHLKTDEPSVVILTGAGISAESGIRTFRDANGLWEEHAIEEVATPEGFARNPSLVHRFYNARRAQLGEVSPNPAHHALAKLEANWPGPFLLVTQNVDDLHDRAGSKHLIHMHGELKKHRCVHSGQVFESIDEISLSASCSCCSRPGALRPHIVWFGEIPFAMDEIMDSLSTCDLFIAIGTSGQVYPAAGFVGLLPKYCRSIEVNPEPTPITSIFQEHRQGAAGVEVPRLVEELLSNPPTSRRGASRKRP